MSDLPAVRPLDLWPHRLEVEVMPMSSRDKARVAAYAHGTFCLPEEPDPHVPACWTWEPDAAVTDLAGLYAWQDGRCADCGGRVALVCDHDHWSGFVRGFLCRPCNRTEQRNYRLKHPAMIHGLRVLYRVGGFRPPVP